MFKVDNKDTRTMSNTYFDFVLMFLMLTFNCLMIVGSRQTAYSYLDLINICPE